MLPDSAFSTFILGLLKYLVCPIIEDVTHADIPRLRQSINTESARLWYTGSGRVDIIEANARDMVRLQRGKKTGLSDN